MKDFDYAAAATVDEAVSLLAAQGPAARVLAGGTDILVQLREGLRDAELVVDVKRIPELGQLHWTGAGGLVIGAAVSCARLYGDLRVSAAYPGLVDAARIIGGWQIQNRASLGGNLCNSSPAADSIPALMAYGAICHLAGPEGRRQLPVAEFCTAPGRNVLARGELLVALELPPQAAGSGAAYQRFIPRNEMDIAVVGCGTWLQLEADGLTVAAARIALGAVAPIPVLATDAAAWLVGQKVDDDVLAEAARQAQAVARPISDKRGPADYRRHLVSVLARRTLNNALERARA